MNVENLVKFKLLNTPEVVEGLAKSKEGIPLIGINRGFEGTYPQIVLEMETGRDDLFADDKTYSIYEVIKVNFYSKSENDFFAVKNVINEAMREINFFRINYYSVVDDGTKITKYTIFYRTTLTTQMLTKQYTEQYLKHEERIPEELALPDGEYFDFESNQTYWVVDGERVNTKP